ncbi:MAG: hypothetical protein R6U44_03665 [Archaeoglobaceae archaeon]
MEDNRGCGGCNKEDNRGQLMLLTAFLMAVGLVIIIILANNVLYGLNLPAFINSQERMRIESSISIFEDQIDELGDYFAQNNEISEENATNILRKQMLNVSDLFEDIYASHGIALDVDIDINKTRVERHLITGDNNRRGAEVNIESRTFSDGSLVIAVDDNQWFLNDADDDNDLKVMRVFGLVYRTLSDRDQNSTDLDDTSIPVYRIIQDSRGTSRDDLNDSMGIPYSSSLNVVRVIDGKNASAVSQPEGYTDFSGGPFIVDSGDITNSQKEEIFDEAKKMNLDIYALNESFPYSYTTKMVGAPRVAIYPQSWHTSTQDYFQLAGLTDSEYTLLNNTEIEQGALDNADVLFVPHDDPTGTDSLDPHTNLTSTAANNLLQWVYRGGVYYTECYGTETIDDVIEEADMNLHPWYGFMGVNDSSKIGETDNGIIQDNIFNSNTTLFASQTYTPDGEVYKMGGETPSFTFRSDKNPHTVPLVNATDTSTATVLSYAPFENGHVIYFGGHDQTGDGQTTPERLSLLTDALLLSNTTKITPAYTIYFNASLNYSDGSTVFHKDLNITVRRTSQNVTKDIVSELSNSNLEVDFVYPRNGYVLNGNESVQVNANGSDTYLEIDGLGWVGMNSTGSDLWNTTIDTSNFSDGEHILAAKTVSGSSFAYESITVIFDNGGGSEPGVGADWEGNIDVVDDNQKIEIKLEVWEDEGENIPLENASVNLSVEKKGSGELVYSNITGLTSTNGVFEGEFVRDGDGTNWFLISGTGDDKYDIGDWDFQNKDEIVVVVEVMKDGELQYFEKEFEF